MSKTIKVSLTTVYDKNGKPSLKEGRTTIQKVQYHYLSGKVCTNTGDVWNHIPNPNQKESNYIAIRD